MSIAANAPFVIPKLRRSGMFVRHFPESFEIRGTGIVTMNRRRGLLPLLLGRRGLGRGGHVAALRFMESPRPPAPPSP